jgi:hypothetical protein
MTGAATAAPQSSAVELGSTAGTQSRRPEAIELVTSKRDRDGLWPLEARYPGLIFIEMDEGEGQPSRWNTLTYGY